MLSSTASVVALLLSMVSVSAVIEGDSALDGANWLDGAPGVAMEYKVHVDAGKEDCYYQYVHEGATLYVSQQVLKGRKIFIHFTRIYSNKFYLLIFAWQGATTPSASPSAAPTAR